MIGLNYCLKTGGRPSMKSLQEIVNTSPGTFISISDALINLFLGVLVAILLKWIYDKYEPVSQYNSSLSKNFITLTLVTIFVISVVKSSLALSLGLVGALSIIRFRTAIKEPTELVYLFLCIAIGLGFGANLPLYTLIVSCSIMLIIILRSKLNFKEKQTNNMYAEVEMTNDDGVSLSQLMTLINNYADHALLIRHDYGRDRNLASLQVRFSSTEDVDSMKASKWFQENIISFSFYEDKGLL